MKRSERWLGQSSVAQNLVDALGHFFRGLISECHSKNRIRRHASLLDQISDAMRDYTRLTGPGTCQKKHRAIHRLNPILLLRIHVL
jgi:hypothetical protein